MTISNISLVIPVQNDHGLLPKLLAGVLAQSTKPFELLVIDSSDRPLEIEGALSSSFAAAGIALSCAHFPPLTPGAARNHGLRRSKGEWIAFLDVKTLPPANWLEDAFARVQSSQSLGILGSTVYAAISRLEKRIRAATYGTNPIVTVPGSVLKRDVFSVVGEFLPTVIAGEDTDWMLRARLHGLKLDPPGSVSLTYVGLLGIGFPGLLRKWWRNYRACRDIPYLSDHKAIYFFSFNLLAVFVAMNWNAVVAHWDESSTVYISHITKITVLMITSSYVIYRGALLPVRRGVSLGYLLPWEWILVFGVGLCIDVVKFAAFLPPLRAVIRRVRYALLRE